MLGKWGLIDGSGPAATLKSGNLWHSRLSRAEGARFPGLVLWYAKLARGLNEALLLLGRHHTLPNTPNVHVWTTPALQEESDVTACGRVQVMCPACCRGA